LFGDFQSVVYLNSEVSNRALELGVPEQQLHCPEVLRSPIDEAFVLLIVCVP